MICVFFLHIHPSESINTQIYIIYEIESYLIGGLLIMVEQMIEVSVDGIIKDAKTISQETTNLVTNTRLLMGQVDSMRELITMYFEAKDWYDEVKEFKEYLILNKKTIIKLQNENEYDIPENMMTMSRIEKLLWNIIPILQSAKWECACATHRLRNLGINIPEEM